MFSLPLLFGQSQSSGGTLNGFGSVVTLGLGMRRGLVTRGLKGGIPSGLPTVVETGKSFLVYAEIQQMLRSASIVHSSHVYIAMAPEPIEHPSFNFLVLQPGPERNRSPRFEGAGRNRFSVDGTFIVHVVTQSGVDIKYSDEKRLLDATRGGLSYAHKVADALHEFFVPSDDPLVDMTDEPLEFKDQGAPTPYRDGACPGWIRIPVYFAYTYTRKVTGSV